MTVSIATTVAASLPAAYWVADRTLTEEHPEIKAKIEERLRNVPEANRERAFINAAKTEAMNQTVRPNGVRV